MHDRRLALDGLAQRRELLALDPAAVTAEMMSRFDDSMTGDDDRDGIAAERLPKLAMAAHPALLAHHDQPEVVTEYLAGGMSSRRVQRIVLMPLADLA